MVETIRPKDLPVVTTVTAGDKIMLDGATTRTIAYENLAGSGALKSNASGIGYRTGAGGAVTQLSTKSTTCILSKACGAITMHAATLNAGAIVSFTLTNTLIEATDVLVLNHISGGTIGSYTLNAQCGAGSAMINVRNNTAGNLGEAIVIQFVLIKGVNA